MSKMRVESRPAPYASGLQGGHRGQSDQIDYYTRHTSPLLGMLAAAFLPFALRPALPPRRGLRPAVLATCSGARSRPSSASSACGPWWVAAKICEGSLPVVWWRTLTGTPCRASSWLGLGLGLGLQLEA